jgi:hypothetical protein
MALAAVMRARVAGSSDEDQWSWHPRHVHSWTKGTSLVGSDESRMGDLRAGGGRARTVDSGGVFVGTCMAEVLDVVWEALPACTPSPIASSTLMTTSMPSCRFACVSNARAVSSAKPKRQESVHSPSSVHRHPEIAVSMLCCKPDFRCLFLHHLQNTEHEEGEEFWPFLPCATLEGGSCRYEK